MAADPHDPSEVSRHDRARRHERVADRCDELADVAELMGDEATANELRDQAHRNRIAALGLLDDWPERRPGGDVPGP